MKKVIFLLFVLFAANVACKKTSINGGTSCGCSPLIGPELQIVIRNPAEEDLLNANTTGAITKDKIEFYRKDAAGNMVKLYFDIRQPFSYGEQKFDYYQFSSPDIAYLQQSPGNIAYLKLDDKTYTVNLEVGTSTRRVEKVYINEKEIAKDNGAVANYTSIFYLNK